MPEIIQNCPLTINTVPWNHSKCPFLMILKYPQNNNAQVNSVIKASFQINLLRWTTKNY